MRRFLLFTMLWIGAASPAFGQGAPPGGPGGPGGRQRSSDASHANDPAYNLSAEQVADILQKATISKPPAALPNGVICFSANGDPIYSPGSKQSRVVSDSGKKITLPANTCLVPAGAFLMGDRNQQHRVQLDAFAVGTYEVTNAEWKAYLDANSGRTPRGWRGGTYPDGKANHPVLFVSENDAIRYCEWISQNSGFKYSLPTEAQWEKAARGTDGNQFPWGNDRDYSKANWNGFCAKALGLITSMNGEVNTWHPGFTDSATYAHIMDLAGFTTPVGTFPTGKSPYGAYDMAGNAYEWTLDWFKQDYTSLPDANKNPAGPTKAEADSVNEPGYTGPCKVIRGGSWYGHFSSCTTYQRQEKRDPNGGYHSVGFRVVVLLP